MNQKSNRYVAACLASFISLGLPGCASISSTPVTRNDDNSFVGDSNGKWFFCRAKPYKGTPVKVRMKSHVDVFVDETYYLKQEGSKWSEHPMHNRILDVRTEPVISEQIIMVDFKRPASGTLKADVDFNEHQYFSKIDSKLVDTTLKDTADLIGAAVKTVSARNMTQPQDNGKREGEPAVQYHPRKRTVAYQRFDIHAPDYEAQVADFISHHLNNCNSFGLSPNYDLSASSSPSER